MVSSGFRYLSTQSSEEVIDVIDAENSMANFQTVFLGFVHNPANIDENSEEYAPQYNGFQREDFLLDKVLSECNTIRTHEGFSDGILLKCCDHKPMFTYLHYALFKNRTHGSQLTCINSLIRQLDISSKSQYGAYDEVFAIQKTSLNPDAALPTHRHAGYIVSCFKILDQSFKQHTLEKSWLGWTGAREIYKYSPRNWNLRRITLHRHPLINGTNRSFAYILLCEFGSILHPSNTIQALDMCERLRARNCGHIALYQVQYNYNQPQQVPPPTVSPWTAVSLSPKTNHQHLRPPRNPMMRGYSQDVDSATETARRRTALLRIRDRSLGYDLEEPPTRYHSYQQFEEIS
uniref:DUF7153 domain-containing protein n=1 Tax=Acrobeloides nanus TaxID=290746 RepID=A0A914E784_9BILA